MKHSFAPLRPDAVLLLSSVCRIDFTRVDFMDPRWFCVTGRQDDGKLAGVCIFEFTSSWEAHMTIVIVDPRCITRRVMRSMFTAVFSRATRITAYCEPLNETAIRQARQMGFQPEGYLRRVIEGTRDAIVLGMLRDECRYLTARRQPRAFPLSEVTDEVPSPA